MKNLKDILIEYKESNTSGRIAIISDIIQIFTFFTAIVVSPKIISLFYNLNENVYFGLMFATTFSIIIILLFFILISFLSQFKNIFYEDGVTTMKLLYILSQVILWGFGFTYIPGLIILMYQIALK